MYSNTLRGERTRRCSNCSAQEQPNQLRAVDEIAQFQNAKYVGSSEAAWRILEHPTHEHFPPVVGLAVHLENGQRVMFTEANARERAQGPPPTTTLTAFFEFCTKDNFAKSIKYPELPEYYTWNKGTKKWERRKRGELVDEEDQVYDIRRVHAIGRIYTISPRAGECYYPPGPTSSQDLRTVQDNICYTFREACLVRGLLENDQHLTLAMEEATVTQSPANLRSLLAIILTTCMPSNPGQMWNLFKDHDLSIQLITLYIFLIFLPFKTLCSLEDKVALMSGQSLPVYGLPGPERVAKDHNAREYHREVDYDQEDLAIQAGYLQDSLTNHQRQVYNCFLEMLEQDNDRNNNSNNICFSMLRAAPERRTSSTSSSTR